jgi:GAF domain-containing protein
MITDPLKLQELFSILNDIHTVREPTALWRHVLERSCRLLQAEGGSFFTVEPDGRLVLAAAVGVDEEALSRVPMRLGVGVCGWVAQHQEAALIPDTRSESRFNPLADQVTGIQTQSLLCVPIFSPERTHGVLEVINGAGGFHTEDLELLSTLGQQTAVAYQNLLLVRETSETKTLLESLLQNMSGGLIAIEAQGNIRILNPSAVHLLGLDAGHAVGKPAAAVLMDYPIIFDLLRKTLAGGKTVSRQETTLSVKGQPTRIGYSTILIADAGQTLLGSGVIFQKL